MLYLTSAQVQQVSKALYNHHIDNRQEYSYRLYQLDIMMDVANVFLSSYMGLNWAITKSGLASPLMDHVDGDPAEVYRFQYFDETVSLSESDCRLRELLKEFFNL